MTTEEKIKEASEEYILGFRSGVVPTSFEEVKDIFVAGALSPEAKEHWQQGMYTEKEVRSLFIAFNPSLSTLYWFDEHKKPVVKHI